MEPSSEILTIKKKILNLVLGSLVTAIIGGIIGGFTVIGNDHITLRDYVKKVDGHEIEIKAIENNISNNYVTKDEYKKDTVANEKTLTSLQKGIDYLIKIHIK